MIAIEKTREGKFIFFLKTEDGNTLLRSIDFSSKQAIIEAVKNLTPFLEYHRAFERKTDHNGRFLFTLKDRDGRTIGESQRYNSEAGMENGIKNLKKRIKSLPEKLHEL